MQVKICDECQKTCDPYPCSHNFKASEWFCPLCHKSYPMNEEEAKALLIAERRRG